MYELYFASKGSCGLTKAGTKLAKETITNNLANLSL